MTNREIFENLVEPFKQILTEAQYQFLLSRGEIFAKQVVGLASGERVHYIKLNSEYYDDVLTGKKTFEVRRDDRDYQVGDVLVMYDWDAEKGQYGERDTIKATVTYKLPGGKFGIDNASCVLGIKNTLSLSFKDRLASKMKEVDAQRKNSV